MNHWISELQGPSNCTSANKVKYDFVDQEIVIRQ